MMKYDDFLKLIMSLPVFDTHEHFSNEKQVLINSFDYFDLLIPYVCDDLMSSGMTLQEWRYICDKTIEIEERWRIYKRYHEFVESGSYFLTVKKIFEQYGLDEIDLNSVKKISGILQSKRKTGYYKTTLKELNITNVYVVLGDYKVEESFDELIFSQIPTISNFCPTCLNDIDQIMKYCNHDVNTLEGIKLAIDNLFEIYDHNNVKAIKIGSAYVRELDFKEPNEKVAQAQLDAILKGQECILEAKQIERKYSDYIKVKELDDFVIWNAMEAAQKYHMTVYVHTGLHAWNYNVPKRCKCDSLVTIISHFSDVNFVLLHCSYPYTEDALLLAKYYPNVFLNLTWVCVIDRIKAKELVKRIIEFIPLNKIALFGGDCLHIESVYGHLYIVREILAQCLFEYIQEGVLNFEKSLEIAKNFLGGNEFK